MNTLPEADPVQKVSIIARGVAAGYTLALPAEDRTLMPRKKFLAEWSAYWVDELPKNWFSMI